MSDSVYCTKCILKKDTPESGSMLPENVLYAAEALWEWIM